MMKHLRKTLLLLAIAAIGTITLLPDFGQAHCQIPCGIYGDYPRVEAMLEDAATISKSIKMINELAGRNDAQSQNQMARWVMNKENHAQKIITTISDYFLTQQVKPKQKDYKERLIKHHAIILSAMKTKQNTDAKLVVILQKNIKALLSYYPEKND